MKKIILFMLCASMFFMVGCQDAADKLVDEVENAADQINNKVAEMTGNDIDKYNAYILLNNVILYEYYDAIMEYFYFFGIEDEAIVDDIDTGMKMTAPSSIIAPAIESAMKYNTSAPKYDLTDAALIELEPLYIELLEKLEEISLYVNSGKFEDDDFAFITDNHQSIIDLIYAYDEVSQKFIDEFDIVVDETTINDLNTYKNNDMLLSYYVLYSLHNAELMRDYFYNNNITNENISDCNYDEIKAIYDEFVMAVNELQALSSDVDAFANEGLDYSYFGPYSSGLQTLKSDMDILIERVKNGENVETHIYEGTPDAIWNGIEDSIDNYNMLISLY